MARCTVEKESSKWRSSRAGERIVVRFPSDRRGKKACSFSHCERVARQSNRDMVVPASISPPFKVVESELALEVFVGSFNAPSVLEDANELLLGEVLRDLHECELGLVLGIRPLDDKAHFGAGGWVVASPMG